MAESFDKADVQSGATALLSRIESDERFDTVETQASRGVEELREVSD